MGSVLPKALRDLIDAFSELPGVGSRTAERYALSVVKHDKRLGDNLSAKLENIHSKISYCKKTFALTEPNEELSGLYTNPERDKTIVAVIASPFDIVSFESIGQYKGTYHVIGGVISPLDGVSPEKLKIKELVERVEEDSVSELIIALNASVEGESTALYIQKQLSDKQLKISRLARGLPVGVDLEYADMSTLSRALEERTQF